MFARQLQVRLLGVASCGCRCGFGLRGGCCGLMIGGCGWVLVIMVVIWCGGCLELVFVALCCYVVYLGALADCCLVLVSGCLVVC